MTAGETMVNLGNGEVSSIIKTIQDNLPVTVTVPCVMTNSYNHPELVQNFYTIQITGGRKAGESKDLPADFLADNNIIDPKQFVGVLRFHITGPVAINGPPGNPPPSNTSALLPRLVQ